MSYEGENKWVPMEKFEELDKIIHCVTEEFWDKYFNESK